MSTFEQENYRWRETYFVLFDATNRPQIGEVEQALRGLSSHFDLANLEADELGRFESVTLLAPDDFAALDISYLEGDEVLEHIAQLAEELIHTAESPEEKEKLSRLPMLTARFDVMHFQQVASEGDEDEADEMFDPSALIVVLEALSQLTGGVGVDPQSGSLL